MENLPLIKFAELNKGIIIRDSFQDIFLIADIDGHSELDDQDVQDHTMPMRLDALLMVLVVGRLFGNSPRLCSLYYWSE